jgi:hypothetical protein
MDVVSTCPLRVGSVLWQPGPGAWALTVIVKGTFQLTPGEATLASEQDEVHAVDQHRPGEPHGSLLAPSDLCPFKQRPDVMLVGKAYAPEGKPTRALAVRLAVADIDRTIEVVADRAMSPDGFLHEGPAFLEMPLVYERAAGGPGTWNPVGVAVGQPDSRGFRALPNLQPKGQVARFDQPFPIVGIGPLAPDWPMRMEPLGPYAAGFSPERWQDGSVPVERVAGHFNAAPPHMRPAALHPDEPIVLENLHPTTPRLSTRLPGIVPRAVFVGERGSQDFTLVCDTLLIDTARQVAVTTYRGTISLESPHEQGRAIVSMRDPRAATRGRSGRKEMTGTTTASIPTMQVQGDRVLPFSAPASGGTKPPPVAEQESRAPATPWDRAGADTPPSSRGPSTARAAASMATATPAAPPVVNVTFAPTPAPAPPPASTRAPVAPGERVELVWWTPAAAARVVEQADLAEVALASSVGTEEVLAPEAEAPPSRRGSGRTVRAVLSVLVRGEALAPGRVATAAQEVVGEAGVFVPRLLLVRGELSFVFDELETARVLVATASPFVGSDEALSRRVAEARAALQSPWIEHSPGALVRVAEMVREAFAAAPRGVPEGWLTREVERALVRGRSWARRMVQGHKRVRCVLADGNGEAVPVYVPEEAAAQLPAERRFQAKVLAEVRPRQDEEEKSTWGLLAMAVGRVLPG